MEQKQMLMYSGIGLVALIAIVFIGYQLTKGPEEVKPAPVAPVQPTVVQQPQKVVSEKKETSKVVSEVKESTKVVSSETVDKEEKNDDEEKPQDEDKKEKGPKKGKKTKASLSTTKETLKEFLEGNSDFYSELETVFDDLVEAAKDKEEKIKERKEEEKQEKEDFKKLSAEEKKELKEEKNRFSVPFSAFKTGTGKAAEKDNYNAKFDKYVEAFGELYESSYEQSQNSIFAQMVTEFEEQRDEDDKKELDKKEEKNKGNKEVKLSYDKDDEKNKNESAEIDDFPCEFVDVKFVDQFKNFISGKSKRIQPFYNKVNEEFLKKVSVKTFQAKKVEDMVAYFEQLEMFNNQLESVFGKEDFNSYCVYNQKGSISVFSFFDFEKLDKKTVKLDDFLDKIRKPKKVYETIEVLIENQHSVNGLVRLLQELSNKDYYIRDMKLTDFAFLVNPGSLDGESYIDTPIYIGEKIVKLDAKAELSKRALDKAKIKEEDIDQLKGKNLKELRKILVDAIQVSIPEDHLYYKQEGFLQADLDFMQKHLQDSFKELDKDERKEMNKYSTKLMKVAKQELYEKFNNQLVVQQLIRSSNFGDKSVVRIEASEPEILFDEINKEFARGKGSTIEIKEVTGVIRNPKYKERRNAFKVSDDDLEKLERLLQFLSNKDYEASQGSQSAQVSQEQSQGEARRLFLMKIRN